jgi:hypothetical protein
MSPHNLAAQCFNRNGQNGPMDKTEIGFRHIHWKSVEMPAAIVASTLSTMLRRLFFNVVREAVWVSPHKSRSGKFEGASHSVKSSVPRALAGVKNGRLTLRAIAGYCFSPLFGLRSTSRDFAALQAASLKARGSKGDRGKFPCKTRVSGRLGFKSPPLSARFP